MARGLVSQKFVRQDVLPLPRHASEICCEKRIIPSYSRMNHAMHAYLVRSCDCVEGPLWPGT